MEFAVTSNGVRVRAQRDVSAHCPQCAVRVIPKCGTLVVHHWAHEANDCDPWSEPETAWHRGWKQLVPDHRIEVVRAGHRADIVRGNGTVVELQHSPIALPDIRSREAAYGAMVWLFDGQSIMEDNFLLSDHGTYWTFRWKHPRKHYALCRKPVYIDLGDEMIFRLKRLHLNGPPYGGWGYLRPRDAFVAWLTEAV